MNAKPNLLTRALADAKRLLLPLVATAAAILGLDILRPYAVNDWAALGIRLAELYGLAGFAYLAWTEATGRTEEPRLTRYFAGSPNLFAAFFGLGVALNFAGSGLIMLLTALGPTAVGVGTIGLAALQAVILNTYLAAAAGQDLASGVQRLIPLIKESKGWAWLLAVVNPGLTLLAGGLLSMAAPVLLLPGTLTAGFLQHLLTMFLTLGLIRFRVDQDAERAAKAAKAAEPDSFGADAGHDPGE